MKSSILAAACAAVALTAAACGSSSAPSSTPSSTNHGAMSSGATSSGAMSSGAMSSGAMSSGGHGMGGMSMSSGTGLTATTNGYTLALAAHPMAGMAMGMSFTITKGGTPVTAFDPEQTKLMHFYLIRSDLTGFQHLHPTLGGNGVWSVTPGRLGAGAYRIYTQFLPRGLGEPIVTSVPLTVPGRATTTPLPRSASRTTVDGYALTVTGTLMHGTESALTITVSRNGTPVTDLQTYLGVYAHVTAVHAGDLAFAHLHPNGTATGPGGPTLTVSADLPEAGDYRAFVQFRTGGVVHTAAITLTAD